MRTVASLERAAVSLDLLWSHGRSVLPRLGLVWAARTGRRVVPASADMHSRWREEEQASLRRSASCSHFVRMRNMVMDRPRLGPAPSGPGPSPELASGNARIQQRWTSVPRCPPVPVPRLVPLPRPCWRSAKNVHIGRRPSGLGLQAGSRRVGGDCGHLGGRSSEPRACSDLARDPSPTDWIP